MKDQNSSIARFPRLPLLEYVEELFAVKSTQPLAGFAFLCVQHLLASTGALIGSFSRCGADLRRMHIVGKGYSSHEAVLGILREDGIDVLNPGFRGDASEPYDAILAEAVASALAQSWANARLSPRGLLLLDDGGHALSRAHETLALGFPVTAVEQTSRGIRAAGSLPLRFPVVNVGRSRAKLHLEAPIIAASMVRNLDQLLASGHHVFGDLSQFLLIGYGAVGRYVAAALRAQGALVTVFDDSAPTRRAASAAGFPTVDDLRTPFEHSCVVVASTGTVSFPAGMHGVLQPGSVLANSGSSDLEFAAWELRTGDRVTASYDTSGRRLDPDDPVEPWDRHYQLTVDGGHLYLLKGGFPVDFDGGPDPIPASAIQLTRALLLAAVLQAAGETRQGLVTLDEGIQQSIIDEYSRLA